MRNTMTCNVQSAKCKVWGAKRFLWALVLFVCACTDHSNVVDPSSDESIADWFRKEVSVVSSSLGADVSSSSGLLSQSASSGSSPSGTSSSIQVASSSSFEATSSSSQTSSSNSAMAIAINDQTCGYTSGSPLGTLVCYEKTYNTVTILSASSSITLMAENLNIGTWVNGTASGANQANDSMIEKYCFDDSETNCTTDGGLYQWAEAMGFKSQCNTVLLSDASCAATVATGHHQGICPTGWHIPKPVEWNTLATLLGGSSVAGKSMKLKTTSYASWDASTYNDGNNSGFSAFPVGSRSGGVGFYGRGSSAYFWEASEYNAPYTYYRYLVSSGADLNASYGNKTDGFSVRCFKD